MARAMPANDVNMTNCMMVGVGGVYVANSVVEKGNSKARTI